MKKGTGIFIALAAAAAGAAAAVFAIKRKKELDQYAYDEFDENSFDDCDCEDCDSDCEDCYCGEEEFDNDMKIDDEEVALDSIDDEIEDNDAPLKSDF